eukprot:198274_1
MAVSTSTNSCWDCQLCTFRNDFSVISCQMCGAQNHNNKCSWQCKACTFINKTKDLICEACNQWTCSNCTMLNEHTTGSCKMCHTEKVKNIDKQKPKSLQNIDEQKTNYMDMVSSICNGNIKECIHLNQLRLIMKAYGKGPVDDTIDKNKLIIVLDDFLHLTAYHDSKHEFEYIIKQFEFCDIAICKSYPRNYRDRHRRLKCRLNPAVTTQILDKIHCYFMHAYDIGYRLSIEETKWMDIEHKLNDEFGNQRLNNLKVLLNKKYDKYKNILKTSMNRNNNKIHQLVPTENNINSNHTQFDTYKFGYIANYGYEAEFESKTNRYNSNIMKRKYGSLKDELLNNVIQKIGIIEWMQVIGKAETHSKTLYFGSRRRKKNEMLIVEDWDLYSPINKQNKIQTVPRTDQLLRCYGISEDDIMSVQHIAAIMIYCNFDVLSKKFSETFRRIPDNETNESLIRRHRNYAHLARLIRESADCFQGDVTNVKNIHLYHGISIKTQFSSTAACIKGPFSTTTQYNVAVNFANPSGCILDLCVSDGLVHLYEYGLFNCQWLSDFKNEQEILFIGGHINGFRFLSIFEVSAGINYALYIHALNELTKCLWSRGMTAAGLFLDNAKIDTGNVDLVLIKSIAYQMLLHELHVNYPECKQYHSTKRLPLYVANLLHNTFTNIIQIRLGKFIWNKLLSYYQKLFSKYFCDDEWINLNILTTIFPSLQFITFGSKGL